MPTSVRPVREYDSVKYNSLGWSGTRVSQVSMGCGMIMHSSNETLEEAHKLFSYARSLGINYFDTADEYSNGRSESALGSWLQQKGASFRDEIIIGTKVCDRVGNDINAAGLSRKHIMRQVESSLSRLKTDYIDIYWAHAPDSLTSLDEVVRAFSDLVRQGKVRMLGFSHVDSGLMTRFQWLSDRLNGVPLCAVQNVYNIITRSPEKDLFSNCAIQNVGFMAISPMAGGFLSGKYEYSGPIPENSRFDLIVNHLNGRYPKYWDKKMFEGMENFKKFCHELGFPPTVVSLAWVMSSNDVTSTIVGPRSIEQFDDVKAAMNLKLSEDDRTKIAQMLPRIHGYD